MIRGFSHYNLRASRETLESLRAFYTEVVGLSPGYRPALTNFGYWLYAGDQAILHLSETRPDETRLTGVATTFDHVAFDCDDRTAMEAHLTAHGIPFRSAHVPATDITQLFFSDPAGNGVELNFSG